MQLIRPAAPAAGARVSLVAAAGPLPDGGLERAIARVRELGWEPLVGEHASARRGYLAGDDEGRLADLNDALARPDNEMIWLLRGGYGTMRIVERAALEALRARPRPLVGFSDNTVLHLAAARQHVVTFHGPHPAASDLSAFSIDCLRQVLEPRAAGTLPLPPGDPPPTTLVSGVAEGPLVGGNLSLLAATTGTPYELRPAGSILFIEEVGEPAYRVDRLLSQLLLAGLFDDVAGVAVGAISECPDSGSPGLPDPHVVVLDRLERLGVPIVYGFPFGHIPRSWTLPVGVRARLDGTAAALEILEPAVV